MIGQGSIALRWKPDTELDYRIELATSWQANDKVYIALCISCQNMFTLQILDIVNQTLENTLR
jgi:hypothetical protein